MPTLHIDRHRYLLGALTVLADIVNECDRANTGIGGRGGEEGVQEYAVLAEVAYEPSGSR